MHATQEVLRTLRNFFERIESVQDLDVMLQETLAVKTWLTRWELRGVNHG